MRSAAGRTGGPTEQVDELAWWALVISAALVRGPEDLLQLVRFRDLELIVAAVFRLLVRAPALEDRSMPESRPLHVVVLHLAHQFDAHRLPRQVLACAPSAVATGHPRRLAGRVGPFLPGMIRHRVLAQRFQQLRELLSLLRREGGSDADVMQIPFPVVQPEQ